MDRKTARRVYEATKSEPRKDVAYAYGISTRSVGQIVRRERDKEVRAVRTVPS